jgi:hypothetical protein
MTLRLDINELRSLMSRSGQVTVGAIIVMIVFLAALAAPVILPWDPSYQDLPHRL